MIYDHLWQNGRIATMASSRDPLAIIEDGAVAVIDGRIAWVGPSRDVPHATRAETNLDGRLVTPGLVDCHTHLVFGGQRAGEFAMRMAGRPYEEIAAAGGGILSSVNATRAATEDELFAAARTRLEAMIAAGVTAVEIKSGYGLDLPTERKMLRVARRLGEALPVHVSTTLLAAHAVPPAYRENREVYVDLICDEILPVIAEEALADSVDGFCESIAFAPHDIDRVFRSAEALGLRVRLHADQLTDSGGAALAARFRALSADHLEYANEAGIVAMAEAGTVAVLLPGASYCLRDAQRPPIDLMRRYNVAMALATDCNPGTSPITSLLLAMNMGVVLYGLTLGEVMLGVTGHAARALGQEGKIGVIAPGAWCDLAVWEAVDPNELIYWTGRNLLHQRIWKGRVP